MDELFFPAGTLLFREGDPGGDIYLIREGEIEVYKNLGDEEVPLGLLKKDDILGSMTTLDQAPRTATARAMTSVKAILIQKDQIQKMLQDNPVWMSILIKDIVIRIKNVNDHYIQTVSRIRELQDIPQQSILEVAVHIAESFASSSIAIAKGQPHILLLDVIEYLSSVMEYNRRTISKILEIFCRQKAIKLKSVKSKTYLIVKDTDRLFHVRNLVKDIVKTKNSDKNIPKFTMTELRQLSELVDFLSKDKALKQKKNIIISTKKIFEVLSQKCVVVISEKTIRKADKRSLLKLVSDSNLSLNIDELGAKLSCLCSIMQIKLEMSMTDVARVD